MNLVLTLKDGIVDKLEWKNNCFDMQACSIHDCKDTSVRTKTEAGFEVFHEEENCMFSDCYTGLVAPQKCDTQIFLTWAGNDRDLEWCDSDNFRISAFENYGIVSYV